MGFHVICELDTESGQAADMERIDRAGGRLALMGATFSVWPEGPALSATVYVERDRIGEAVAEAVEAVTGVLAGVGEPVKLRSVCAYTEAEFDRVHVRG